MKIAVLIFDMGTINQRDVEIAVPCTLSALRKAIANTFENHTLVDAHLSIVCISADGKTKTNITKDEDLVGHLVEHASLDITVESSDPKQQRSVKVSSAREGDFFAQPHDGTASLPLSRNGLLEELKKHVIAAHSLAHDVTLNLTATTIEGAVPLVSDIVVENVLEELQAGKTLEVSFCPVASIPQKHAQLKLTLQSNGGGEDRVHVVSFAYQVGTALLSSLKQEVVHVFDLPQESNLLLSIEAEGAVQPIPSDRALEEALVYLTDENPIQEIHVKVHRVVAAQVAVEAEFDGKKSSFAFEYEPQQERLLGSLKDTCRRNLHLDVGTSIVLTAVGQDKHNDAITSDNELQEILRKLQATNAVLHITVRIVTDAITVPVECAKELVVVKFPFTLSIEGTMLVHALRNECGVRLQQTLHDNEHDIVVLDEHDNQAPLTSDTVLRDVITQLAALNLPLRLVVKPTMVSAASSSLKRNVQCTLSGETAEFSFTFSLVHPNLLLELLRECKAELDLMPSDEIALEANIDGDTIPLRSDREVREILVHLTEAQPFVLHATELPTAAAAVADRPTQLTKRVECEHAGEVASFELQFTLEQDGLLDHLVAEAKDELDLMPNELITLRFVDPTSAEEMVVDRDAMLREILSTVAEPVRFNVIVRSQRKTILMVRRDVQVTLDGETATFELNFALSEDGLLSFLHGECLDELDLLPNEKLQLTFCGADGLAVPVATDAILRQILVDLADNQALQLEATLVAKPRVKVTREIHCTLKDDTAVFSLQYAIDDENLLQNLVDECKEELDLLPTEIIALQANVDGELAPLRSDRDLRELFCQLETGAILQLIATEVVPSPAAVGSPLKAVAALSHTVTIQAIYQEEKQTLVFRYRDSEETERSLLKELSEDIRAAFDLGDGVLNLSAAVEGGKHEKLPSEEALRALLDKKPVELHVTAELSAAAAPPNREAELHALYFDWLDVLHEPEFDAADIRLVVSNVRVNGATLPSTDPLCVKLSQFAGEEQARTIRGEFFPFLQSLVDHLDDEAASKMCHIMRDVLDFLVDRSPNFRLKRLLSVFFRRHAVNDAIDSQKLQSLLAAFGSFDADDVTKVFEGASESLNQVDYNAVMGQLFDLPQLAEFMAFTEAAPSPSNHSKDRVADANAVRRLRNIRISGDLRHAFDGIMPFMVVDFVSKLQDDETLGELIGAVSALAGGPSTTADAIQWAKSKSTDDTKAAVWMHDLMNHKGCELSLEELAKVCTTLVHPSLDPSLMLSVSPVANALAVWAMSFAKMACQKLRCGFPPVLQLNPRPPSARSTGRARGFSSPMALRAESLQNGGEVAVATPKERFEPKYRYLSCDLQIVASKPSEVTLRSLTATSPTKENDTPTADEQPAVSNGQTTPPVEHKQKTVEQSAAAPVQPKQDDDQELSLDPPSDDEQI